MKVKKQVWSYNIEINEGMKMKEYFKINVHYYDATKNHFVVRPASLDLPKDNAVMFVTEKFMHKSDALLECNHCLVFWPYNMKVPDDIKAEHAIVLGEDPRAEYCKFYKKNKITNIPKKEKVALVDGAYIAKNVKIGDDVQIMPGAYIGGDVLIGNHVYIGSGVKITGEVSIGNHVIIRENTVIGADGLSTNRDEEGKSIAMPQFGGVIIEDNVEIGALAVIARGAIDDTVLHKGCKIDNSCFVSHNVQIGSNTLVVGETIFFGSSSTGERAFVSGNVAIREGIHVGKEAVIGMGSVVVKPVADGAVVKGNPAR